MAATIMMPCFFNGVDAVCFNPPSLPDRAVSRYRAPWAAGPGLPLQARGFSDGRMLSRSGAGQW